MTTADWNQWQQTICDVNIKFIIIHYLQQYKSFSNCVITDFFKIYWYLLFELIESTQLPLGSQYSAPTSNEFVLEFAMINKNKTSNDVEDVLLILFRYVICKIIMCYYFQKKIENIIHKFLYHIFKHIFNLYVNAHFIVVIFMTM